MAFIFGIYFVSGIKKDSLAILVNAKGKPKFNPLRLPENQKT